MITAITANNIYPVFVYGTLMKDQSAAHHMDRAEFLGEAILEDYAIYDLGWYPGIKPCRGEQVYGEVYMVDDDMLQQMDRYEGEGFLYLRKLVMVKMSDRTREAFVYVYNHEVNENQLIHGRWDR